VGRERENGKSGKRKERGRKEESCILFFVRFDGNFNFLNHLVILRLTLYIVDAHFSQTPFFVRFLFNYLSNLHM
jgi:hypothetical protein